MTMFSIRVELHGASSSDYEALATSLASINVVDTIVGDNGIRYKLPPAEYNYVGQATMEQVHEAIRAATSTVGRPYAVVTNEVRQRIWVGLDRA